jgi:hypothetical protein
MRGEPIRATFAPRVMAGTYRHILRRLVERRWAPPRRPIRVGVCTHLWIVLRHGLLNPTFIPRQKPMRSPLSHVPATPASERVAHHAHVKLAESNLDRAIDAAACGSRGQQRPDGHWVFELEADATISAEYIVLQHFLGEPNPALEAKIANYLRRLQGLTAAGRSITGASST